MKLLYSFILLLAPCLSYAQDSLSLSKMPSKEAVQSAKELIKSASSTPTKLRQIGYALIDIKIEGELTNYVPPGSDDCIKTLFIPKNSAYEGWLLNKDEAQPRWTRIEPVAWDRVLVTGTSNGSATLIWMTVVNNKAVVIAAFQFQVGNAPPKPVDPVDPAPVDPVPDPSDTLVSAARSDIKAGKGTANDAQAYSMIYLLYSTQVKNDKNLKNVGDLYKEMNIKIDTLLGDDIEKAFPTLRKAVGAELRGKIPTNAGQVLDDATRATISNALASIYTRLQGVK